MIPKRRWQYGIALSVLCTLIVAFLVPTSKYRRAVEKYRFGMPMKEAQALMAKRYDVDTSDRHYEGGPTERQMEEDQIYFITVQDENVTLVFNHHKRLIEIWKSTWFTRSPIIDLLGLDLRKAIRAHDKP
jgi:hypothetical protein